MEFLAIGGKRTISFRISRKEGILGIPGVIWEFSETFKGIPHPHKPSIGLFMDDKNSNSNSNVCA